MGDLVFIDVAKRQKDLTVQEAWEAYLVARDEAERSRDIEIGIRAAKAWARWLELFTRGQA